MRSILRSAFRILFHILGGVVITGRENVPKKGAYIIAINHVSIYDPPFIVSFWPKPPELLGAADVWHKPGQSTLVQLYGGIQVHRGEYDRQAIEAALSALKAGYPILMAPEGGRSHTPGLRLAKPGVAFLLKKAQVPVLPVGIVGTTEDYWHRATRLERPTITMHIGAPFRLFPQKEEGEAHRISRQKIADQIMIHIAALLPQEYRGVYSNFVEGVDHS